MKLSVKSLTITAALVWGICFLFVSALNFLAPPYGQTFLDVMGSVYPGYKAVGSGASVIIGTLYALVDGAVGGALFGVIYNRFAD